MQGALPGWVTYAVYAIIIVAAIAIIAAWVWPRPE
jgi:hypothetical protein